MGVNAYISFYILSRPIFCQLIGLIGKEQFSAFSVHCVALRIFALYSPMTNSDKPQSSDLESFLLERYGPLLHGRNLWLTLGYVSAQAFRKAIRCGTVPVTTFTIENRRGRFAKTRDVVEWLETLNADTAGALSADRHSFDNTVRKGGRAKQ
jgi:hypothetical protein